MLGAAGAGSSGSCGTTCARNVTLGASTPWKRIKCSRGRGTCHASGAARGTETTPLATEGDQLVVAAVGAAQPQEAVGQDAAFEEGVELVLDEWRPGRWRS